MNSEDIDFGLNANLQTAIDACMIDFDYKDIKPASSRLVSKKSDNLPPYEAPSSQSALEDAIIAKDCLLVSNLLYDDLDLCDFLRSDYNYLPKLAIENFDKDTMSVLMSEKLRVADNGQHLKLIVHKILLSQSFDMLDFFLDRFDNIHKIHFEHSPTFNLSDKELLSERTFFIKTLPYKQEWLSLCTNLLIFSEDDNVKHLIDNLEKRFPHIINASLHYNNKLIDFLECSPLDSQWHKDILSKVPLAVWDHLYEGVLPSSITNSTLSKPVFNIKAMSNLFGLMDDNEHIKKSWNDAQTRRSHRYNEWKDWYDKYLPEDVDIENSYLYQNLPKLASVYKSYPKFVLDDRKGESFFKVKVLDYIVNKSRSDFIQSRGVSLSTYLRLYSSESFSNFKFTSLFDTEAQKPSGFTSDPIVRTAPSIMHLMVETSSPAILPFLRSSQGIDIIKECLSNPYTKHMFLTNCPLKMLIKIVSKIPHLKDDIDDLGNCMGHSYTLIHNLSTLSSMETLFKLSPAWFLLENKQGKSIIDLSVKNGLGQGDVAKLERMIIKAELKKDDLAGAKLRSRNKYSKPKRKM